MSKPSPAAQLRDAFRAIIDGGFIHDSRAWSLAQTVSSHWRVSTEVLPPASCDKLGVPHESTYGDGARVLLDLRGALPSAREAARLAEHARRAGWFSGETE